MDSQETLFQEMASQYDVQIKAVQLTPERRVDIAMVGDIDALLEKIDPEAFKKEERLPYWAELWPASIALGRYLLSCPIPPGARVLELGCGLGLPAIVAAKLGCRALATDYEEAALKFARYNALRNGVAARMAFRTLDWRAPALDERFPYIVASDIWFDTADIPYLRVLVDRALEEGGTLIASDPGRSGIGARFFEELVGGGYDHGDETFEVDFQGAVSSVRVHRLGRRR